MVVTLGLSQTQVDTVPEISMDAPAGDLDTDTAPPADTGDAAPSGDSGSSGDVAGAGAPDARILAQRHGLGVRKREQKERDEHDRRETAHR